MNKKGDISINTTVMAAIALVVLVVLIAIFGGRIRDFLQGARDCRTMNGGCEQRIDCEIGKNTVHTGTDCNDRNPKEGVDDDDYEYICCVPLLR